MKTTSSILFVCALVGCASSSPEEEYPEEYRERREPLATSYSGEGFQIAEVEGGYELHAPGEMLEHFHDGDEVELGLADDESHVAIMGRIQFLTYGSVWVSTSERLAGVDLLERDASLLLRRSATCSSSDAEDVGAVCSELNTGGTTCRGCSRNPTMVPYNSSHTICYCAPRPVPMGSW